MEQIISRWKPQSPEASLRKLEEFVDSIKGLPIAEAEQRTAERRFREPVILFDRWAIRPFWKDGRKAPSPRRIIKGDKALELMVRGH